MSDYGEVTNTYHRGLDEVPENAAGIAFAVHYAHDLDRTRIRTVNDDVIRILWDGPTTNGKFGEIRPSASQEGRSAEKFAGFQYRALNAIGRIFTVFGNI